MIGLKKFVSNKKGSFSIVFVILCLIGVILATGFLEILQKSYQINELQSMMDVAGTSALTTGVDQDSLRTGFEDKNNGNTQDFAVDTVVVENTFKQLMRTRLNNAQSIKSYEFRNVKAVPITEKTNKTLYDSKWGLGQSNKKHPQAVLDSTIIITMESQPMFDVLAGDTDTFFDAKTNSNFTVTYLGSAGDGLSELAVRSVTRLVYR